MRVLRLSGAVSHEPAEEGDTEADAKHPEHHSARTTFDKGIDFDGEVSLLSFLSELLIEHPAEAQAGASQKLV